MNTNKPQFFSSIHSCPFVSIRGSISVLALYLLLASSFLCLGANSSEHLFLWNEANAIMTSATTPEDYLTAAQAYQNLIDAGICNGPICYNMGTALLHAGRYNSAIDALLRAE